MWLRAVICLGLVSTLASFSSRSTAQSLVISGAPPVLSQPGHSVAGQRQQELSVDTTPASRRWYGWETLSLDVAALGMAAMSFSTFDGQGTGGALLGSGALSTYAFGAPAVHLLRDQPNRAVASLGLRVGLPVMAVGLVAISNHGECPAASEEGVDRCQSYRQRLLIAGTISVVLASLIDGVALAWEPTPKPKRLALTPLLAWDGSEGGLAGVAGAF